MIMNGAKLENMFSISKFRTILIVVILHNSCRVTFFWRWQSALSKKGKTLKFV